jgi:hypothetical protein
MSPKAKDTKIGRKGMLVLISEPRFHPPCNAPVEPYLYTTVSFYKDHNALLTTTIFEHIPLLPGRLWSSPHTASLGQRLPSITGGVPFHSGPHGRRPSVPPGRAVGYVAAKHLQVVGMKTDTDTDGYH